jgi:organic radical activating enzyme
MALRRSVPELVAEAVASGTKTVVVTGGEPTIYDLTELTRQLHRAGIQIHLETSGGFPIRGHFDYIIISPKKAKFPIPEALELADDLKLIVEDTEAIRYWMDHFDDFKTYDNIQDIWLHVEWSQHKSVPLLELITTAIKFGDSRFRAGWQMHKNFRADTFDTRSAAPVPLGGNKALGY